MKLLKWGDQCMLKGVVDDWENVLTCLLRLTLDIAHGDTNG